VRARLVEAPSEEPISVGEAKSHLRLETEEDDAYLEDLLIPAARQVVEELCWRGFVTQKWELVLEGFCGKNALELPRARAGAALRCDLGLATWTRSYFSMSEPIELPRGNLAELDEDEPVESVKYIDPDGVERTLATTEYTVDDVSVPARIIPAVGKTWPATRSQWDAVRITYWVGWEKADVPAPLKQAMLIALAEMYEHRTPDLGELPPAVRNLAGPYRLNEVG
jgi:hypothetical protein